MDEVQGQDDDGCSELQQSCDSHEVNLDDPKFFFGEADDSLEVQPATRSFTVRGNQLSSAYMRSMCGFLLLGGGASFIDWLVLVQTTALPGFFQPCCFVIRGMFC